MKLHNVKGLIFIEGKLIAWCSAATSFNKILERFFHCSFQEKASLLCGKCFLLIFTNLSNFLHSHPHKKMVKKTGLTFKQPSGAWQKCCTSCVVIGRKDVAGWSTWQPHEKAETGGVTLPFPLHSSGSCCGNTPVPWRHCDRAWLTLRIHSDERFFVSSLHLWTCSKFRSEFNPWECWDVRFCSQTTSGDASD